MKKCNFGKKVQYFREKQGMTQEQLAEAIDKSQNFISALERGKKFPGFETLVHMIDALDVTANDLMEDIIKNGYQAREHRLANRLDELSPDSRNQILAVVETMIDNSPKI